MVNKKAQLSFANVLNWVILVILVGVISLVLNPILIDITGSENNSVNKLLINLIVPFLWLAVLLTLMMYAQPQAPMRPY